MVHISRTEVTVPCLLVSFFAGENNGAKPYVLSAVLRDGFMCLCGQFYLFAYILLHYTLVNGRIAKEVSDFISVLTFKPVFIVDRIISIRI